MFNLIPKKYANTAIIRLLGLTKIPVIFFVKPTCHKITDDFCVIKIPLNRRTKNHQDSMYFGVLAVGADLAGGMLAMNYFLDHKIKNFKLLFKDFNADFHKRAEGDVYFTCRDGETVHKVVEKAQETGQRQNHLITVIATCPDISGEEPVATFKLTLSIKVGS